ncbi:PLP-dependent aminotransferase family protein [Paraburkholderia sp. J10-1]|uniref:aminotransferase-like domain-containing protein n=1 Tax=Paraburkholderia sp. J10-1 TaxID=2805430 RepID=UPI002AB73235|nr:PLP-dependent aminotransferase family protein [Paraburkholderia sp. J10-1]
MKLYEKLADDIETLIRKGVYRRGDRVPSVRQASQQHRISITTVIRAYLLLESRGVLESRPQSGYFVSVRAGAGSVRSDELRTSRPIAVSATVDVSRLVLSTLRSIGTDDAVPLGSPYPDPQLFPYEKLNRYAAAAGRRKSLWGVTNALPPGTPELVRQIARRYLENGMAVDPNEIIVTVGATEAINLCLQAVAKPGDVIAVESPTFYAMLHAIERSGMKAIEVATHPEYGIEVEALAKIIESGPIAACMVMPNFQNPLGFQMPDERKRELVDLLEKAEIPVIENGVYNELYFGDSHPTTLKSYDKKGMVLHCGSFSKSLTAAYRIGWALPGRYRDEVEKLKFLNTLTTSVIPQLAIAEYLERDGYEHHLRRIRKNYAQQCNLMKSTVTRFFPAGTRTSTPMGGYVLWIELPAKVDSMTLYQLALARGITIGPGYMFSVSDSYRNFIRLNYSTPWSPEIEQAVITVGRLAASCAR